MEVTYNENSRFSGFQWAMMVFVFFVITMALSVILRDFQATIGVKRFVFSIKDLAPFIAAIVCILVFKHRKEQLAGLKFSISLKVIERLLLALILPLIILMIGLFSFNTYADSFILLQTSDLSVSLLTILIGHILMAFVVEFGFRSYLQNILETRMNTFLRVLSLVLFIQYLQLTTYGVEYAGYHFLYTFMFSMIIGELIRATNGRTIYIATAFHASMTFALVFLFSEETGDLFSMKVIALSTTIVGVSFIIISLIIRAIVYKTTKQSLDEVDPNNYLSHIQDEEPKKTPLQLQIMMYHLKMKQSNKILIMTNINQRNLIRVTMHLLLLIIKKTPLQLIKKRIQLTMITLKIIQLIPKIDTHLLSTMLKMKFTKLKIIKPTQINHINN